MEFLLRSQRVSHHRFAEATGWTPRVADAADGLARLGRPAAEPLGDDLPASLTARPRPAAR
jgi:hypothetical protein